MFFYSYRKIFLRILLSFILVFSIINPLFLSVAAVPTVSTSLTLDAPSSPVQAGSVVTFTGRLVRDDTGVGLSGFTIYIYDDDYGAFDGVNSDLLSSGVTDANGYFSIDWIAEDVDIQDDIMEAFALFAGTSQFENKLSQYYHNVEVIPASTSLTLDVPPASVQDDSVVTFTGRLVRDDTGVGLSGFTVYLYDFDIGSLDGVNDDLLGSGVTDANGYFSVDWTAVCTDTHQDPCIIEVYVWFAGSSVYKYSSSSLWHTIITSIYHKPLYPVPHCAKMF